MPFKKTDNVQKHMASMIDDIDIAKMIEERDVRDSGRRHSLEEVRAKRRKQGNNSQNIFS